MANTRYKGSDVLITIDGTPAIANITITKTRNVIDVPSGNLIGKLHEDGSLDVSGTMTLTYFKGDISRRMTGGNPNSGPIADVTLHEGLAPPGAVGTETTVDMTTTDAQGGVICVQALTSQITGAGYIIFTGTGLDGQPQIDRIEIPIGMGVNEKRYGTKPFSTVTHAWLFDWVQPGGTIRVLSTARGESVNVDRAVTFDLIVKAIKNATGRFVQLSLPECFFTKETFQFENADSYIGQPMEFSMKDVNKFEETYLD